ncbi:MAG: hypothetical protein GEU95_09360 [Rhizobiales bacterium]|nr:hypothetical protein [Hyphomicrobiales bacterium]
MAALRSVLVTLAILLGLGAALAQQGENLAGPEQKAHQEKAQHSEPGRAGTTEPGSEQRTTPDPNAALVDGRLVVPGAPADSQTVPSKYSERNAALDALPTMAFPLPLTDDQRQRIREAVSKAPVADTDAHSAELLPTAIEVRELPDQLTAAIPAARDLGYVRTADRVLLISPANRIVVGEIKD